MRASLFAQEGQYALIFSLQTRDVGFVDGHEDPICIEGNIANENLATLPRHIRVIPSIPCETGIIRRELGQRVEVGAGNQRMDIFFLSIDDAQGGYDASGGVVCMVFYNGDEEMDVYGARLEIGVRTRNFVLQSEC